jgi:hypothetical protein
MTLNTSGSAWYDGGELWAKATVAARSTAVTTAEVRIIDFLPFVTAVNSASSRILEAAIAFFRF